MAWGLALEDQENALRRTSLYRGGVRPGPSAAGLVIAPSIEKLIVQVEAGSSYEGDNLANQLLPLLLGFGCERMQHLVTVAGAQALGDEDYRSFMDVF